MKKGFNQIASNIPGFGSINIFYNAGGKVEKEGTRGISHLAEHLLFKSVDYIDEKLSAYGIKFNAFTSEDYVYFYFNGLNESLKLFENDIIKILSHIPSREDFEKEKKIVLSEYSNVFSKQNAIFPNILRKYFNRFGAIGYKKDIEEITYEQFLDFISIHFKQPTYISRIGDTDFEDYYKTLVYSDFTTITYEEKDYGEEFLEFNTSSIHPLISHWFTTDLETNLLEFISLYLSSGLSSPLYQALREKNGLVYYVGADTIFDGNIKPFCVYYECENKNKKDAKKVVKELFKNLELNEDRFENIKKMIDVKLKKQNIFNFDTTFNKTNFEDVDYKHLQNLTYEEFQKIMKNFCKDFLKNEKIAIAQKGIKI